MYKANKHLPPNVQKLFRMSDKKYKLRGNFIFEKLKVRTNRKLYKLLPQPTHFQFIWSFFTFILSI